ncbi:hypothetical protein LSAT2_020425, partial [Lamellibrachia satsuma]
VDEDGCVSNPCQNGGTCNVGVNGYTRSCDTGYSGQNSDIQRDLFSYNGKFTIINRVYSNKLTDKSSSAYKNMSAEVNDTFRFAQCLSNIGRHVVEITEINFRKGSVISRYQLVTNKEYTPTNLTRIIQEYIKEHNGTLDSFVINANSVTFLATTLDTQEAGSTSNMPIILGTVFGNVALVIVVLVIILVVKKMKKPRVVPILVKKRETGPDI